MNERSKDRELPHRQGGSYTYCGRGNSQWVSLPDNAWWYSPKHFVTMIPPALQEAFLRSLQVVSHPASTLQCHASHICCWSTSSIFISTRGGVIHASLVQQHFLLRPVAVLAARVPAVVLLLLRRRKDTSAPRTLLCRTSGLCLDFGRRRDMVR